MRVLTLFCSLVALDFNVEGSTSHTDRIILPGASRSSDPSQVPVVETRYSTQSSYNDTDSMAVKDWVGVREGEGTSLASVDFHEATTTRGWYRRPIFSSVPVNHRGVTPDEAMTRYPSLETPGGLLRSLDYLGTASFAMGGAVSASLHGMELPGAIIIGIIAAMGGGTTRDILLGQTPVFWIKEAEYLGICVGTAVATFLLWPVLRTMSLFSTTGSGLIDGPLFRWLDTIGLGAFSVVGSQHGIRNGFHPLMTIALTTITCSGGGIIRDVLTNVPVKVLQGHAELYITTAAAGSAFYLMARRHWSDPLVRLGVGFLSTVMLRFCSWTYGLSLSSLK